jgi:hypothetical protein
MKEVMQRASPDSAQTSTNPLGGGGGGGGGFRGGGFGGGGFGGGTDPTQLRLRVTNALAAILTEEQMAKYQAMGSSTAARNSTVYVLDAKGKPVARTVRVGLASDSMTEVLSGLEQGEKVIVRARTEQKKKA